MAKVTGRDVLMQVEDPDNAGSYINVGSIRTKGFEQSQEFVDVSDAESGQWEVGLPGAGIFSATMNGSGFVDTGPAATRLQEDFESGTERPFRFVVPGFRQYDGNFFVTNLTLGAEYNNAVTLDVTFRSSGQVTSTAVA